MDILFISLFIGIATYLVEPDDLVFGLIFETTIILTFAVALQILKQSA